MSNIIVTGAGRGIAYHTCLSLLKDPANRVIGISRTQENLDKLLKNSAELPGQLRVLSYDLQDFQFLAMNELMDAGGFEVVDILVNAAAMLSRKSFEEHEADDYRLAMEVNYIAPAMLVRHLLPRLRKSAGAHIVNVGSVAGVQGSSKFPGLVAYGGSKAALISLTEFMAQELDDSIRVNAVAFGSVDTEMLRNNFPGFEAPLSAADAGAYLADFAVRGRVVHHGKIVVASVAAPY